MELHELNALSPLRAFDESLGGGLGKGNLGVLVSRHGIGKTACLVQLATDKLFHNEHIVHISFSGNVEHVINWYKEVFRQIAADKPLKDASAIYNEILANRVVMNFSQENISIEKVLGSLETLIRQGSFNADAVMFDGYKLTVASEEDVRKIKQFALDMRIEAWFSVSPVRPNVEFDENGVPSTIFKYEELIDALIGLKYDEKIDKVVMTLVKHEGVIDPKPMRVTLDPKTMMIST
jgi:hypothetical protein